MADVKKAFFEKLDSFVAKKKDLKGTIFDLDRRFDDVKLKVDLAKNNLFSGLLSDEERLTLIDNVKSLLELYQELKDVEHYEQIIDNEAKEKKIQFTEAEKDRFDDSKFLLRKSIPWKLVQTYQDLNHSFREYIANIFVDKYLSHYTPEELKEVTLLKENIMSKVN